MEQKRKKLVGYVHKVHTYKEFHSVCPLVGIGLSRPISRQRVCPSPRNQMGVGHTRLRVRGWGSRLEKKLSTLPTL
jgi:hypothetical protein